MAGIIRIPKIYPAKIRSVGPDAFRRLLGHMLVDIEDTQIIFLAWKILMIMVIAIEHIINLQIACLRLALAKKHCPVIGPA